MTPAQIATEKVGRWPGGRSRLPTAKDLMIRWNRARAKEIRARNARACAGVSNGLNLSDRQACKEAVARMIGLGVPPTSAMKQIRRAHSTYYRWLRADPQFRDLIHKQIEFNLLMAVHSASKRLIEILHNPPNTRSFLMAFRLTAQVVGLLPRR